MTFVSSPGGMSYALPQSDWSAIANLANDFYQGAQNQQQYQQSQAFKNGLPTDAQGNPDYRAIMARLAQLGDVNAITALSGQVQQQQQQAPKALDPMFGQGGATGAGSVPVSAQPGQTSPSSGPGTAAPVAAGGGPLGGAGQGQNVATLVAQALPGSSLTPTVAANIAKAVGVAPDAPLTPQQQAVAQRYLNAYVARTEPRGLRNNNPDNIENGPFAQSQTGYAGPEPQGRYAQFQTPQQGIAAGSNLLADYAKQGINTVTGVVSKWAPASDGNDTQAYSSFVAKDLGVSPNQPLDLSNSNVRQSLAVSMAKFENGTGNAPNSATGNPQGGGALVPQVPLPRGYTDPEQAILALNAEAAKISNQPGMQGQVAALQNWSDAISRSLQPIKVTPTESILDPRTGRPLYQGAYAQGVPETAATLDADAQRYLETGTLPPNMGRGVQGAAQSTAIRQRAEELAEQQGIDPATLPQRWQQYRSKQTGMRVLEQRAANLELAENESKTLIPRVLDASSKVSRTQYPTLNSVIMAAEKGTGDPNVVRLGVAASSLIYVYARVLKPTGVLNESDTKQASEILNKAWSQGQIEAALDQMTKEINAAKTGLAQTQQEYEGGSGAIPDVSTIPAPSPTAPAQSGSASGRPTITNAQGQRMILSPDGKSWVPLQ